MYIHIISSIGWKFASLIQGFYCICSSKLTLKEAAICSWECTGDNIEICGGAEDIATSFLIGTKVRSKVTALIFDNNKNSIQYSTYICIL